MNDLYKEKNKEIDFIELDFIPMTLEHLERIESVFVSDFDDFWNPSMLKEELQSLNSHFFILTWKDDIIGFAGIKVILDEADLMNIVIKKCYRGMGFGTFLLTTLLKECSLLSISSLTLEVQDENTPAILLYQKLGFESIGIRKNYYPNHHDAILMKKKI